MVKRWSLILFLVSLAWSLAACSNTSGNTAQPVTNPTSSALHAGATEAKQVAQPVEIASSSTQATPVNPDCPKMSAGQPLPARLPKTFPLPNGTAFTSQETRSENRLILNGVIPANLPEAKAFFEKELNTAGYKMQSADSEAGEAEADYEGNGVKGRWLIRGNAACPGITTISLLVQPA